MSYVRDNTDSGTKVADLYADLSPLLTANGWTQVGATLTINSTYWHIWKNPAANSGLSKDFHVAIGYATNGTGFLRFRMFEDWTGSGNEIQRWVPRRVNSGELTSQGGGYYQDAYGKALTGYSSTAYPIPWTPGTGAFARAGGDYSVGAYDSNGSLSGTQEEAVLNSAPHAVHLLSAYVAEYQLQCNDTTAIEYILTVNAKRIFVGVKRVYDNAIRAVHAGAYEALHANDPMPICINYFHSKTNITVGYDDDQTLYNHSYTRWWGFDGAAPSSSGTWDVKAGGYFEAYGGIYPHTAVYGILQPDWAAVSSTTMDYGDYDALGYGVVLSRAALRSNYEGNGVLSSLSNRALLHDVLIGSKVNTAGTPAIKFGDEITINGQTWLFVGAADASLSKLDDASTSPSSGDPNPIFVPKF